MNTNEHEDSSCDILQVEGINSKGFGIVPKLVMQDERLSIVSKAIYCYFCSYAGAGRVAFPRVTKITTDLKISRATYYTHFGPLRDLGFIKVEQTRKDGRQSNNIYTLTDVVPKPRNFGNKPFPPCTKFQDTVFQDAVLQDAVSRDTEIQCAKIQYPVIQDAEIQETEFQDSNNNSIKNNRSKSNIYEKHPPYPPAGDAGAGEENERGPIYDETTNPEPSAKEQNLPSENLKLKTGGGEDKQSSSHSTTLADKRFEMFWEAYPKKVGKTAAFKAWKRLGPDAPLFASIMAAIPAAKNSEQWQRENGRFIPNPLTWINQGRWDDVYSERVPQAQRPAQQQAQAGNAITRILARLEAAEEAQMNDNTEAGYDN